MIQIGIFKFKSKVTVMFPNRKVILLIVFHFSGLSCQFLNCKWVNGLDCTHYTAGVMCGSNGQDYPNRCYLAKAQCSDHNLSAMGSGTCVALGFTKTTKGTSAKLTNRPTSASTTHTVATTKPTSDPLRVICDSMAHVHCASDIEPVCGSDDRTYVNTCEFHMEVCQRHDLTIKHIGFC